ncbi:ACP S-malonyltransferase [Buchnera aphidicola (Pemphigus obesinymphae)]|uniref:ACP S-malonyltransferase n=1 Tax=Buchnera aphidicola TaxID=9 RepID=UPI002238A039|nr:ACP S-malonyltransferase [Buchnera aphidicola]MCW5196605.1 ACP S-malonyltransferase [Buchnera aphidicola (Pemphigus obesinymphae)]
MFSIIFPGQGIKIKGILTSSLCQHPIIKKTFEESSCALGYDLFELIKNDPKKKLNQSEFLQPAILSISVAIYRLWRYKKGPIPFIMAGNSLGEYSALVCSNVITLHDAIKLVEFRGKLMQRSVNNIPVAMSAIIGLNKEKIIDICKIHGKNEIVEPSNFNSLNHIVISGHKEAVEKASIACKKYGAKYILPLSVNIASHCQLMQPAKKKLMHILNNIKFNKPTCPIINNIDVKCESSKKKICIALLKQLTKPVRWHESIEYMVKKGVSLILEAGPNSTLTNINKRNFFLEAISLHNKTNFLKALKLTK